MEKEASSLSNSLIVHFAFCVLLTTTAVLFWHPSLDDFFAQDDFLFLQGAQQFAHSSRLFLHAMTDKGFVDDGFRPLSTTAYFTIMYLLFGLNPFPYHLMNLLLHLANAFLVYCIAMTLFKNKIAAIASSLFFLTRSVSYVTVFWISCVQELLPCLFGLLTVYGMIRFIQNKSCRWLALALPAFVLGLFSKEIVVAFAPALVPLWLMVQWPKGKKQWRDLILFTAIFLFLALLFLLLRHQIFTDPFPIYKTGFPHFSRFLQYVAWIFHGDYEQTKTQQLTFVLTFFILLFLPLLLQNFQTSINRYAGLGLASMAFLLSLPTLILTDRITQYYDYIPGIFLILATVGSLTFLIRSLSRAKILICTFGGLAFLLSMFLELMLVHAKDQTTWIKTVDSNGNGVYSENPNYQWSGGWLNTSYRLKIRNLTKDLIQVSSMNFPADTTLVFVGINDFYVTGKTSEFAETKNQPVLESLVRTWAQSPTLQVRTFQQSDAGIFHPDYELSSSALKKLLADNPNKVYLVLVHPIEGYILDAFYAHQRPPKTISALFRQFYNTAF